MHENVKLFTTSKVPLHYLQCIENITLAYETYGELNAAKDNAILVIHGFSFSSHVAAHNSKEMPGWWEWAVGAGKPIDTNEYFVVCANNFGGCFGSTGPVFPPPSISDMVFCQQQLQAELGIEKWHTVIGGSLGGMAVLEWVAVYPEKVRRAICLNAGIKLSFIGQGLMNIQQELVRLMSGKGLYLARSLANLSYVGEEFFQEQQLTNPNWQLKHCLQEEAGQFVKRFNSDSYLSFLQAMCGYELNLGDSPLSTYFCKPNVFLVGCVEDILFPIWVIEETQVRFGEFVEVNKIIVNSKYGHDAFLMDEKLYSEILKKYFA
jgi:Homoserine acetyltransferase